jgi:hypothetical protein
MHVDQEVNQVWPHEPLDLSLHVDEVDMSSLLSRSFQELD